MGLSVLFKAFMTSIFLTLVSGVAQGNEPLIIYPLGDSITRGIDNIGYRQFLFDDLKAEGVDVQFVGSLSHGPEGFSQSHHEGHNGWTIGQLDRSVDQWLSTYDPDVILLMAGANDIQRVFWDWKGMPSRMGRLIDTITTQRPNAIVLVSELTVLPLAFLDKQAVVFNEQLQTLVEAKSAQGLKVHFVPMHDTVLPSELIKFDHPNSNGNRKVAARWLEHLRALGIVKERNTSNGDS